MFFWQNSMVHYVLHCIDLALVLLAFALAYTLKAEYLGPYAGLTVEVNYFLVLLIFLFYCNFILTYFKYAEPVQIGSRFRELIKAAVIVAFSHSLLILTLYVMHEASVSRLLLAMNSGILLALLYTRRLVVSQYIRASRMNGKSEIRIIVVGSRDRAKETIRAILQAEDTLYTIVGCLEIDAASTGQTVVDDIRVYCVTIILSGR